MRTSAENNYLFFSFLLGESERIMRLSAFNWNAGIFFERIDEEDGRPRLVL